MDVMIDIETTGTEPGCAILSIGARVAIDLTPGVTDCGKAFTGKMTLATPPAKEWPLDRFLVEAKEQGLQYVGAMAALDNEGRLDAGED